MAENLMILAGRTAYHHIRKNGLSPSDIQLVFGASGAAKWLVLYGLDSVLYGQWFKNRTDPLHLFGTSVGAWKFAAAAQDDPQAAFDRLKQAYIHLKYTGRIRATEVSRESRKMLDTFLSSSAVDHILSHPVLRIGYSAVRCKSLLASKIAALQALGMWSAFELNFLSRKLQKFYFERTFFHDPRYDTDLMDMTDFPTTRIPLDARNCSKSMLATASLPVIMKGVTQIPGAPKGLYRDGGLLDYHPVFPLNPGKTGFILYPHFYAHITPGWFDKRLSSRRAAGEMLDRIILLAPSPSFVAQLPFGRIPDRQDFIRLRGKDDQRMQAWEKAAGMSRLLGEEFMDAVKNGCISDRIQRIR
ncbi:MAG: patatin-like phospholipase family protein [Pseudomonadota bacterium]